MHTVNEEHFKFILMPLFSPPSGEYGQNVNCRGANNFGSSLNIDLFILNMLGYCPVGETVALQALCLFICQCFYELIWLLLFYPTLIAHHHSQSDARGRPVQFRSLS